MYSIYDDKNIKDIQIKEKISLSDIINTNDILTYIDVDIFDDEKLLKAINSALKQLNRARLVEGKQIHKDLLNRIKLIKIDIGRIEKLSSKIIKKKIQKLLVGLVEKEFQKVQE